MGAPNSKSLESFDRTIRMQAAVSRPETARHLDQLVLESPRAIARGAGLSYSAASFGSDALVIDMTRFDRVLNFEPTTGQVTVEPGIAVGVLTEFLARHGRYLPALPGYPAITVGGCVAFDIHGKSQVHSGHFRAWVESLTLYHTDHGMLHCSRESESEVFELTIGGMGLTGIITRVGLRTQPLPSTCVQVQAIAVNNLHEAAEMLRQGIAASDSSYSWNDLNQRGDRFGQGVVYVEHFVPGQTMSFAAGLSRDVKATLPFGGWNRATTGCALGAYGLMARRPSTTQLPLQRALFPIYGKEYYYALFGRAGFREYQVIIPHEKWTAFVHSLQILLKRAKVPLTLGSLKVFQGSAKHLRFAGEGICLALDVPATPRSLALFELLDELVVTHQGVINLSKDSRVSRRTCELIFPEYEKYVHAIQQFDPKRRYGSSLTQQIGL